MANLGNVPIRGDRELKSCPTCGFPVRIIRDGSGRAKRYEAIIDMTMETALAPQDPIVAAKLRLNRKGKKTVALVGMSPSSCSLAPFDDPDVEIWTLNETHAMPWMKRIDRCFQIHPRKSFEREVAVREVRGHFEWLKQVHNFPIYMQYKYPDIPDSIEYPLQKARALINNLWVGDNNIAYFTATFPYMMAMAIMEEVERIEIYGFDMAEESLYGAQKECALLWIGMALGKGIEIYLPPNSQLILSQILYGYKGMGPRNLPEE